TVRLNELVSLYSDKWMEQEVHDVSTGIHSGSGHRSARRSVVSQPLARRQAHDARPDLAHGAVARRADTSRRVDPGGDHTVAIAGKNSSASAIRGYGGKSQRPGERPAGGPSRAARGRRQSAQSSGVGSVE